MTSIYSLILILAISSVNVAADPPDILPKNCAEAVKPWEENEGVFKIELRPSTLGPFEVFCIKDPEGGPAWTLIQRRMDGSVNFFRNWNEYESGFGNLKGEHFLGLKKIHELSNFEKNELWIQLTDFENDTRWAKYGIFSLGDASKKYIINVGNFSGCTGDSLSDHNGSMFNTYDMNDPTLGNANCATYFKTAWWMRSCYSSDLNGKYLKKNEKTALGGPGIKWLIWEKGAPGRYDVSLKYAHMALRPARFSSDRGRNE